MADVRRGIAGASGLVTQEIDGVPHWYAAELPDLLAEHRRAARGLLLLPGFDELILGYADRTPTLDRDHETLVVPGRNGMFKPTVVTGGRAVGTWRRVKVKGAERIEATPSPARNSPPKPVSPAPSRGSPPELCQRLLPVLRTRTGHSC